MQIKSAIQVNALLPFGSLVTPQEKHTPLHTIAIDELRDLVRTAHLIILRGFAAFADTPQFSHYCTQWGKISLWPFGEVLELKVHEQPQDHIFAADYVPLHWDGMYRPTIPEYQIFHCVTAPLADQGGQTCFVNTRQVLAHASKAQLSQWSDITIEYERSMAFYSSRCLSPLITAHPHRDYAVLRYNEPHAPTQGPLINPPHVHFVDLDSAQQAIVSQDLRRILYDPRFLYTHQWADGDVVIADNFTLLHGRHAFAAHSPRHIQRVQIESDPPYNNPGLVYHE